MPQPIHLRYWRICGRSPGGESENEEQSRAKMTEAASSRQHVHAAYCCLPYVHDAAIRRQERASDARFLQPASSPYSEEARQREYVLSVFYAVPTPRSEVCYNRVFLVSCRGVLVSRLAKQEMNA